MSPELRKYTIWMEQKLIDALQETSKRTHIPASALARLGIEKILLEYKKKA